MIDYQLKPCCKECLNKDVEVETKKFFGFEEVIRIDAKIYCRHQKICVKYNKKQEEL